MFIETETTSLLFLPFQIYWTAIGLMPSTIIVLYYQNGLVHVEVDTDIKT